MQFFLYNTKEETSKISLCHIKAITTLMFPSAESQAKCDVSSGSCCANLSESSPVCELYQVEEIDLGGMMNHQME